MSGHIVIFLAEARRDWRWLRIEDHAIVARGEGAPVPAQAGPVPVVAVVPADWVALHWAALPDRSAAQALAAARLIVAQCSAAPADTLHVAIGAGEGDEGGERPVAVITHQRMQRLIAGLAEAGIEPGAILPSPLLLARPSSGFVYADLGAEAVIRGAASGFADDAVLTPLLTDGAVPERLDATALEAAIIAAAAAPQLDLLQGNFARKRRFMPDWRRLRVLGLLAAGVLALALTTSLVQVMRYSASAQALEQQTEQLARQGLSRGETVNNASAQLADRMTRLRGAGIGFSRASASVFQAVVAVPGCELRMLSFDANGDVRMTLVTQTEGQIIDVKTQLEAMGFIVRPTPFSASNARFTGDFTVSRP